MSTFQTHIMCFDSIMQLCDIHARCKQAIDYCQVVLRILPFQPVQIDERMNYRLMIPYWLIAYQCWDYTNDSSSSYYRVVLLVHTLTQTHSTNLYMHCMSRRMDGILDNFICRNKTFQRDINVFIVFSGRWCLTIFSR